MIKQYHFPDIPKLPSDLRQAVIDNQGDWLTGTTYKLGEGRKVLKNGEPIPSITFRMRLGPEDLVKWVEENVTQNFIHVCTTQSDDPTKTIVGPHIDLSRNYTILYPLRTGGDQVSTVFYRLKSGTCPSDRQYYLDYNELEEIDRVVIPLETWCVINSKCIHSVEGIEGSRHLIQIGLWDYVGLPDVSSKRNTATDA